jgi:hypothetical protein
MDREQVERLTHGVRQAQDGMRLVGGVLVSATTALNTFGSRYAQAVEAELARMRARREARRG